MSDMIYKSTRGHDSSVTSSAAILRGIAPDGGLYVPSQIPKLGKEISELMHYTYQELAEVVMREFLTDFTKEELRTCINKAYDSKFDSPLIAPLKLTNDVAILELFHGPTLAFKDMALSVLPHLLKTSAKKLGSEKEIIILTATSGDTGKAAMEGFADVPGTKIIVFFPENGVSPVQKAQMVTQTGSNTHVIGIVGNFDDAQTGVKKMFTDSDLAQKLESSNMMFSSANSINIGRLVPQVVYYFRAYADAVRSKYINNGDELDFVVPTGNFGNILAGYYAKQMGLPVGTLVCASNENKVLFDFISSGKYDANRKFKLTMSPSMDILISSNLERLLYAIAGNDGEVTASLMEGLKTNGTYEVTPEMKERLKDFHGGYASEEDTAKAIKSVFDESGYVMDTHTAVAFSVWQKYKQETKTKNKAVIVSTASPYKFATDVLSSIDTKYAKEDPFELLKEMALISKTSVPKSLDGIENKPVLHKTVCDKAEMQFEVEKYLKLK